jgi:hypothetical protein
MDTKEPENTEPKRIGRPPGSPNKATARSREAIATFLDGNLDRLQGWLDEIAEKDPKAAFGCLTDLMEFSVPKLARVEHTGEDGGAINVTLLQFRKPE